MAIIVIEMIKEIGENIERFAGKAIRDTVMEGSERISPHANKGKIAKWIKGA